ncbi:MAG: UDP-N-acetyl-D-glucosamine 2-epimerase, UDP-hydrolyzing [Bacteroidetes bacterium]|nr:UDP-N-acetyl-D-glucosamine 2-epimerase, UDP-hydrolyzing [Bacteroidota bacterium]
MRITILTSSRADYSIYLPLLKKLKADTYFELRIIAFGSHLSHRHGYTLNAILDDGFRVAHRVITLPKGDSPRMIAEAMASATAEFSEIWETEKALTDLVFCLGDRYEMFAAVAASVPFTIPVAHLHGGETTLGAIDNSFRHAITAMSRYHFVSTEKNAARAAQITGSTEHIYNVGAMSLDNLREVKLLSREEFKEKFSILPESPILVTFHPETISWSKNELYTKALIAALEETTQQIIITMPNADTGNEQIRKALQDFAERKANVHAVESLGTQGYFSCIEHCAFLLGNSSSGIIEAASFGKYVINLGSRQEGREAGENVIHCAFEKEAILEAIKKIGTLPPLSKENIYGDGRTSEKIVGILKTIG